MPYLEPSRPEPDAFTPPKGRHLIGDNALVDPHHAVIQAPRQRATPDQYPGCKNTTRAQTQCHWPAQSPLLRQETTVTGATGPKISFRKHRHIEESPR